MTFRMRLTSLCLTLALLSLGAQHAQAQGSCDKLTVLTRNMYLGTDFAEVFGAGDELTLLTEVAEAFAEVQASDPRARIKAIAHEIQTTRPDLVSLQEVALWQTGPFDPSSPSANTVAYDYLQLLLDELNSNGGLHYEPVAVLTNLVAEAPALGPEGFFDVRFTDRVAVLARTDLKKKHFEVENVVAQHFATVLSVPTAALGTITIPRGYIAADVERCGQTFRFVNAHLESFEELLGLPFPYFRFAQATELLLGSGSTGLPLVLAGDFNADAENPTDPTYQLLLSGGLMDAWQSARPDEPGYTWPLFSQSPFVYESPSRRLDLVLTRGAVEATKADMVGENDLTPRRPMTSDHAGVVVNLRLLP
ncbi:MAG: endonuclease/exonuclease/phosphatase family protein [Acidobacteria bacterium]|nr:endonuclease/exonuclease/phosphatase family protein [Acidobacteriota bacterium]